MLKLYRLENSYNYSDFSAGFKYWLSQLVQNLQIISGRNYPLAVTNSVTQKMDISFNALPRELFS